MTLACEDANSKLVEVITVADVDQEDRVGKLLFRPRAQGLVKILKLAADVWLMLRR